jgi:hypothetical protein
MTRLSALTVMLLSAWLGAAILVATVVAPAAFKVLPTRTLAGALVGRVLPVIFVSGLIVAAIVALLNVRGPRERGYWLATGLLAVMMISCVVAQFVIAPKIEVARAAIGGPVESIEAADPRRMQFGRLHAFSVLWMGVAMVGAGGAIVQKLTQRT